MHSQLAEKRRAAQRISARDPSRRPMELPRRASYGAPALSLREGGMPAALAPATAFPHGVGSATASCPSRNGARLHALTPGQIDQFAWRAHPPRAPARARRQLPVQLTCRWSALCEDRTGRGPADPLPSRWRPTVSLPAAPPVSPPAAPRPPFPHPRCLLSAPLRLTSAREPAAPRRRFRPRPGVWRAGA